MTDREPTPDEQTQIDTWLGGLTAQIEAATAEAQAHLERITRDNEIHELEAWYRR